MLVRRSDNYVGGLGATVLANALAKNTSLRELYIKGNELGDTGVEALCKAFSGVLANATCCDGHHGDRPDLPTSSRQQTSWVCQLLIVLLGMRPALECDSCCGTHAERDGEMHVLDLGNNSISREGASALAAYMKKSSGLKELNLYMNDIGTAGITEVHHRCDTDPFAKHAHRGLHAMTVLRWRCARTCISCCGAICTRCCWLRDASSA